MATTPKGRALGIALRKVRKECGITLRELASMIGRHSGEISRWENAERPLTPERVAQILTALGVNGERFQEIVALAYDSKNPPWVATTLPEREQQLSALIEFEQTATLITAVAPLLVPGLLQDRGYIQAIMSAGGVPPSEIPTRIAIRVGRRDAITRAQPVRFVGLIGEAVLHQVVGSRKVMAQQLRHLGEMNGRPNVSLRVIPYKSGWHPALEGAFTLIDSDNATPIVQLENRRSTLLLHEEDDVSAYQEAIEQLQSAALNEHDSIKLISGVFERLEKNRDT
ncbi:helix-turn-helix domain-containing protein [Saccharopolyspora phatthalungensis]|uniref:Transcriptional regulator with XRE-family HTH domain n=1 Tax=Saccharopolyspora phatthalungensis TaxID=664693 RepID=A0A840PWS6_9PSEU|nr:helix-turn-helix transcriptional regulator [Saccharopolyspora phatthalungensis]MBB5154742.1 transcriptional regulator with XRE-family HTH domain [Saccharopolyspora phatthalungensis]